MQGSDIIITEQVGMEDGNIAVAHDPFGLLREFFKIDPINDASGAIPPAGTENGIYFLIVQHLLEITQSFLIGAGKIGHGSATNRIAHFYIIAPLLQDLYTGLHFFEGHIAGRTYQSDGISFLQVRGELNHA